MTVNKELTAEDWAWLAGFIDGEGHIGLYPITKTSYSFVVGLTQSNKEVMNYIKEKYSLPVRVGASAPEVYRMAIRGEKAYRLLKQVYPFLVYKKEQAEGFLTAWDVVKLSRGKRIDGKHNKHIPYLAWVGQKLSELKRDKERMTHG